MEVCTQKWLDKAYHRLDSFTANCENGETTQRFCLKPDQYNHLVEFVDAYVKKHSVLGSMWKDSCEISGGLTSASGDWKTTREGWLHASLKNRYYGPIKLPGVNNTKIDGLSDDESLSAQQGYYAEAIHCKINISPPPSPVPFDQGLFAKKWKEAKWTDTTCHWVSGYEKRHFEPVVFNCSNREWKGYLVGNREGITSYFDLDLNHAHQVPETPAGVPLMSGGDIEDSWKITTASISALFFAYMTYRETRKFSQSTRNAPEISSKHSRSPQSKDSGRVGPPSAAGKASLKNKPSIRPVLVCAGATIISTAYALYAYTNLERTYCASFTSGLSGSQ